MKTGPHGACLTAASLREAGKTPASQRRGKPGSGAEPSGGTGGECRERERRKAACRKTSSTQPRLTRTLVGQCAFRRSAFPFCWRVILSENRKCTFRDHALSRKRVEKSRFPYETDSLASLRRLVVRNTRMPRHRENAEACHSGAHRRCEPGIHSHDPGERMFCEDGGYGFWTRHRVAIRNDEMRNAPRE